MREATTKREKRYTRFFFYDCQHRNTRPHVRSRVCFSDIMCVLLTRTHRAATSSAGANSLNIFRKCSGSKKKKERNYSRAHRTPRNVPNKFIGNFIFKYESCSILFYNLVPIIEIEIHFCLTIRLIRIVSRYIST